MWHVSAILALNNVGEKPPNRKVARREYRALLKVMCTRSSILSCPGTVYILRPQSGMQCMRLSTDLSRHGRGLDPPQLWMLTEDHQRGSQVGLAADAEALPTPISRIYMHHTNILITW